MLCAGSLIQQQQVIDERALYPQDKNSYFSLVFNPYSTYLILFCTRFSSLSVQNAPAEVIRWFPRPLRTSGKLVLACLRPVLSSVCKGPYWVLIPPQELSYNARIVQETWGDTPVSFVPVELVVDSACVPYHTGQTTKSEISRNDEIHKESYKASTSSHTRGVK